jgi:hypothetical protein
MLNTELEKLYQDISKITQMPNIHWNNLKVSERHPRTLELTLEIELSSPGYGDHMFWVEAKPIIDLYTEQFVIKETPSPKKGCACGPNEECSKC